MYVVRRQGVVWLNVHHCACDRLAIVSNQGNSLTMNLKAPLLVNLQRRLGRQVIAQDDAPVQYELTQQVFQLRKSA